MSSVVIPKEKSQQLRRRVKALFRRNTTKSSLNSRLKLLNPLLNGWGNFYRHAHWSNRVFSNIDHYVWWTILRWLKKKHQHTSTRKLIAKYGYRPPCRKTIEWREGAISRVSLRTMPTGSFQMGRERPAHFAKHIH